MSRISPLRARIQLGLRPKDATTARHAGGSSASDEPQLGAGRIRLLPERLGSFRFAILLLFLIPMMLTVAAIVYKMSERAEAVVYQLSSRIVTEIGEQVVAHAAGIVRIAEAHLLSNAAVAAATPLIPGQVLFSNLFWQELVFTPELTSVFIGDRDGSFVQASAVPELATRIIDRTSEPATERIIVRDRDYRPLAHLAGDASFDPRTRPWYLATRPEPRIHWTDTYRFSSSRQLGITATYPVLDQQGHLLAVLGIDATLESISELLSRQAIGRRGAALILDAEDRLVAYPRRLDLEPDALEAPAPPLAREIELPWLRTALAAIQPAGAVTAPNRIYRSVTDGRSYLTHVIEFGDGFALSWRLVIVLDESDLLSTAGRALRESIVTSAIIVVLALLLVYPLTSTFAASVAQLTRNTQLLRRFRPAEVIPVTSPFHEIKAMDQAICEMRDVLTLVEGQLPGEVVRQLAIGTAQVELRAEFKSLTLMSSALSNLDALFEALPADRILGFLIEQIEHGRAIIRLEAGTADQCRGDRLHAFWDLPAAPDQAARHACRAALAFNHSRDLDAAAHGVPGQVTRQSGLHTGRGLVGNLGVAGRLRYTAMGTAVEIANRLRSANAVYGTRIIISEALYREVKDRFRCRVLDSLRLPGETRGTPIYELRGDATTPDETDSTFIQACELAFASYLDRAWESAIAAWQEALAYAPGDPACRLMIARCQHLQAGAAAALPEDWDGTLVDPCDPHPPETTEPIS